MDENNEEVDQLFNELKEKISVIKGLEDIDPRDFYSRIISIFTSMPRESL
jgi:hypothetical protein